MKRSPIILIAALAAIAIASCMPAIVLRYRVSTDSAEIFVFSLNRPSIEKSGWANQKEENVPSWIVRFTDESGEECFTPISGANPEVERVR